MNIRKWLYIYILSLRGINFGYYYRRFIQEDQKGIPLDTSQRLIIKLLEHSRQYVPYYREIINRLGDSFYQDPINYLKDFPILTKEIIRERFDDLKSEDLPRRKWHYDSSGGSTGEPVHFIHDYDFAAVAGSIKLLFSKFAGREVGELEVYLWGSERDIIQGSEKWQTRVLNKLTNTIFINTFRWTPESMRQTVKILNSKKPRLIVAYLDPIYEFAKFIEQEGISVVPQKAIITSTGTLNSVMRDKIEKVFKCRVYNRYGSREFGDIACERPGYEGLWVAPWGNYIEVVDNQGKRVPEGIEGELLITSLSNYAMPLIRYRIEDIGVLSPIHKDYPKVPYQVLDSIIGRTNGTFRGKNGVLVSPGYFTCMLCNFNWIRKYQVIQKSYTSFLYKIVKVEPKEYPSDIEEIIAKTKLIMGNDCEVHFEFVDDIPPSRSGKFHYTICEF